MLRTNILAVCAKSYAVFYVYNVGPSFNFRYATCSWIMGSFRLLSVSDNTLLRCDDRQITTLLFWMHTTTGQNVWCESVKYLDVGSMRDGGGLRVKFSDGLIRYWRAGQ